MDSVELFNDLRKILTKKTFTISCNDSSFYLMGKIPELNEAHRNKKYTQYQLMYTLDRDFYHLYYQRSLKNKLSDGCIYDFFQKNIETILFFLEIYYDTDVDDFIQKIIRYDILEHKVIQQYITQRSIHSRNLFCLTAKFICEDMIDFIPSDAINFLLFGVSMSDVNSHGYNILKKAIDKLSDPLCINNYFNPNAQLCFPRVELNTDSLDYIVNYIVNNLENIVDISALRYGLHYLIDMIYAFGLVDLYDKLIDKFAKLNIVIFLPMCLLNDVWHNSMIKFLFKDKVRPFDQARSKIAAEVFESVKNSEIEIADEYLCYVALDLLFNDQLIVDKYIGIIHEHKLCETLLNMLRDLSTGGLYDNDIQNLVTKLFCALDTRSIDIKLSDGLDLFIMFNTKNCGFDILQRRLDQVSKKIYVDDIFDFVTYNILQKLDECSEFYGIDIILTKKSIKNIKKRPIETEVTRTLDYIRSNPKYMYLIKN